MKDKRIWYYVRISFWFIVAWWFGVAYFVPDGVLTDIWALILFSAIIFNFVNCIRHLSTYKEKALAITSLVLSSLGILILVFGLFMGIMITSYL